MEHNENRAFLLFLCHPCYFQSHNILLFTFISRKRSINNLFVLTLYELTLTCIISLYRPFNISFLNSFRVFSLMTKQNLLLTYLFITSMAKSVMAASVAMTLNKEPNPSPSQEQSTKGSIKQLPSPSSGKLAQTTGFDSLREHLHAKGIPKSLAEFITNSHQQGFLNYYELAWAKWSSCCIARKIYPTGLPLS